MAGMAFLLGSCGDNSTTSETKYNDSAAVTTTDPNASSSYTSVDVPASTRTTFETKYPSAKNVQWTRYNTATATPVEWDMAGWPPLDTNDYVVAFDWDGYDYYAWYDEGGNWIGSTYTVTDHSKLPASVNSAIQKDFAGYTIVEVDREMDKNRSAYEVELQKGDDKLKVLFDDNGKVIKKKTRDADGNKTKEKPDQK